MDVFQVLCETSSLAAANAFATIGSAQGRRAALAAAAEEFFRRRRSGTGIRVDVQEKTVAALFQAYETASIVRNTIVHGVAAQLHGQAYFLCAQSLAGKTRHKNVRPTKILTAGATYAYNVCDIDECARHFVAVREQARRLVIALSISRRVQRPHRVHP